MKIKTLTVSKPFMYLWLKTVKDVDLSNHCAKSLIGEYNSNINAKITELCDLDLSNDVHYLCGVSKPYNWHRNFHLAFRYSKDNILEYSNNGISVVIQDAEMLPISSDYIEPTDVNAHKRSYSTCRNWQFAHYFDKHLR